MWPNPQFPAGWVTFTEEIFNEKLHFFVQWRLLIPLLLILGLILEMWLRSNRYIYANSLSSFSLTTAFSSIYPSSFTNVRFWTKIYFSNFLFHEKRWRNYWQCRWEFQGAVSSATGLWQSPCGFLGGKAPEKFWPFYIWGSNE